MEITTLLTLVSWTYVGIVVIGLELIKQLVPKIKEIKTIVPTLVFALIVAVAFYLLDESVEFGTLVLSFLMSVALYDVFVRPLKDATGWK